MLVFAVTWNTPAASRMLLPPPSRSFLIVSLPLCASRVPAKRPFCSWSLLASQQHILFWEHTRSLGWMFSSSLPTFRVWGWPGMSFRCGTWGTYIWKFFDYVLLSLSSVRAVVWLEWKGCGCSCLDISLLPWGTILMQTPSCMSLWVSWVQFRLCWKEKAHIVAGMRMQSALSGECWVMAGQWLLAWMMTA